MSKYHLVQHHVYRQVVRDNQHWTSPMKSLSYPLNSTYHCTGKCSQLDVTTSKKIGGLFGPFTHVPINPSAHPTLSHCTHHNSSHSRLCTTLIHNITKLGYYGRHITDIITRCHQIPAMFQCRNQDKVKSK